MNEQLIRASLDQSLLALAALDNGTPDTAAAHGAIAQVFATFGVTSTVPPGEGHPTRRVRIGQQADPIGDVVSQWVVDIETLNAPNPADSTPEPSPVPEPLREMGEARRGRLRAVSQETP